MSQQARRYWAFRPSMPRKTSRRLTLKNKRVPAVSQIMFSSPIPCACMTAQSVVQLVSSAEQTDGKMQLY